MTKHLSFKEFSSDLFKSLGFTLKVYLLIYIIIFLAASIIGYLMTDSLEGLYWAAILFPTSFLYIYLPFLFYFLILRTTGLFVIPLNGLRSIIYITGAFILSFASIFINIEDIFPIEYWWDEFIFEFVILIIWQFIYLICNKIYYTFKNKKN